MAKRKKAAKKTAVRRAVAKKTAKKAAKKAARPMKAAKKAAKPAKRTAKPARKAAKAIKKTAKPVKKAAKTSRRKSAGDLERATTRHSEPTSNRPSIPSSLNVSRSASKARSGRLGLNEQIKNHPETGPAMTAGDVDADWEQAYSSGDEAPGGDNPTPDQDVVEEIGTALGVTYQDDEELKGANKISDRDRHRWELDPASAEDYPEHDR